MENRDRISYLGLKKDKKTLRQFFHIFFEDLNEVCFTHPSKKDNYFSKINKRLRPIFFELSGEDPLQNQVEGEMYGGSFNVAASFIDFQLEPGQFDGEYRDKFTDLLADNFPIRVIKLAHSDFHEIHMVFLSDQISFKSWKNYSFPSVHSNRPQLDIFKVYHNIIIKLRLKLDDELTGEEDFHKGLAQFLVPIRESLLKNNDEFLDLIMAYISSRSMFANFEPRLKVIKNFKRYLLL